MDTRRRYWPRTTLLCGLAALTLIAGVVGAQAMAAPAWGRTPDAPASNDGQIVSNGGPRVLAPASSALPGGIREEPSTAPVRDPLARAGEVLLGGWTIAYEPGPENGDGVNVQLPLRALDGFVIRPGRTFEFWSGVGEVSRRSGYRPGALVVGNRIEPQGALAGGICIASTAVFNAALHAGLQIVSRHSHGVYLARYPLGLDAAVAIGGGSVKTVAFRNDTDEPITIRTSSQEGIATVELFAPAATGRVVTLSEPDVRARQAAGDIEVRTSTLDAGERRRTQDASDGMTVHITRTVRDVHGTLIRRDRFVSHYRPLAGRVEVGAG